MKFKNIKGIIWDLDGTLLDSFGIFKQIISDLVKESGHDMPADEFMLLNYHGSLEETVKRILGIESDRELDHLISSFLKKQEHHYSGDLDSHLFNDSAGLAQAASKMGIHQLLVTNRAHNGRGSASPKFIIANTALANYINEVLPIDEVDYAKPDIRSTGDWINRFKLKPENILVIGDQFVDAKLALNIGARVVLVKRNTDIPHINKLEGEKGLNQISIVDSLDEVTLA